MIELLGNRFTDFLEAKTIMTFRIAATIYSGQSNKNFSLDYKDFLEEFYGHLSIMADSDDVIALKML